MHNDCLVLLIKTIKYLAFIACGDKNLPSESRLSVNGKVTALGICPATTSMGSISLRKQQASRTWIIKSELSHRCVARHRHRPHQALSQLRLALSTCTAPARGNGKCGWCALRPVPPAAKSACLDAGRSRSYRTLATKATFFRRFCRLPVGLVPILRQTGRCKGAALPQSEPGACHCLLL